MTSSELALLMTREALEAREAQWLSSYAMKSRDTKGRHKESSLWGDGWAWSLFNAEDPKRTVSKNYKTDCLPCHTPAKELARANAPDADKWIYAFGYPVLQKK